MAALAGLPAEVTDRAREILKSLEKNEVLEFKEIQKEPPQPAQQLPLFETAQNQIIEELRAVDLASTTPLQALNLLYQWQQELKKK